MGTRAIVNPRSAGGRTGRRWADLERRLRDRLEGFDAVFTSAPGDATRLAAEAIDEGVEHLVAVGGDGTVNEVVNGMMGPDGAKNPQAALSLMMLGTGGDFRKSLGLRGDIDEYIDTIVDGEVRQVDLGRITMEGRDGEPCARWFDNIASFGFSGAVVDVVNRATISKWFGGKFAFRWASFRALLAHVNEPLLLRIDDDYETELPASIVAVCNGQYFGGGMWIAPDAEVDDGQFDIVMVSNMSTMDFIRHGSTIYAGKHLALPNVTVRRGRKLVASAPPGAVRVLDVDGEAPGRLPATFEIHPGALRIRAARTKTT
jgi:YegS/Rv2252/BmrU family lipid kinase